MYNKKERYSYIAMYMYVCTYLCLCDTSNMNNYVKHIIIRNKPVYKIDYSPKKLRSE